MPWSAFFLLLSGCNSNSLVWSRSFSFPLLISSHFISSQFSLISSISPRPVRPVPSFHSHLILSHLIPSLPIPSYPMQSHPIPSYSIPSYSIPYHPISSYPIPLTALFYRSSPSHLPKAVASNAGPSELATPERCAEVILNAHPAESAANGTRRERTGDPATISRLIEFP